jgi:hypothetical protein
MILLRRLTLLSLVVALLLSPPGVVGTVSGQAGGLVDETLVWNQVMLDAIVASSLGNPQTMRMAATVNTAMFDARNGVGRNYTPIFVTQTAPPGTHRRAAVVQAAYVSLMARFASSALYLSPSSMATTRGKSGVASTGARTSRSKSWRGVRPTGSAIRCLRSTAPAQYWASGSPRPVPPCRRTTSLSPRRSR